MKIILFALSCCTGLISARLWRCDYDFYGECEGWLKFHEEPATWHEARMACHYEGAQLASPTPELLATMRNIIQKNNIPSSEVYIGIHATYSKRIFTSIEGIPLSRIPHTWAEGNPINSKDPESCIALNKYGTLMDLNCAQTRPFICYKYNSSVNSCGTIDNEYVQDSRTGSCYKFHRSPRTWSRAYAICEAEGGYLAIINSETEAQIVREILAKNPENSLPPNAYKGGAILGYKDHEEHGEWITVHGQTLAEAGYDKFGQGQPDNYGGKQYCGSVFRSGLLDDMECDGLIPFICEKDPDSLMNCGDRAQY